MGVFCKTDWLLSSKGKAARAVPWLVSLILVTLAVTVSSAASETRSLKLYYLHTGEREVITYKRNGKYIDSGLKKINRFLRDWRRNEPTKMDPRLLDLVWDVYQKSGSKKYIHVISGYRSPATNKLLRKRGRGVAKKSQHTRGKALDFFLPDVKLSKLRNIGLKMGLGGVGFYPKSGSPFIHLDTGRVRHWPRMSRKQLVRVFPNGKTLHVPSDGKPLAGYEQARAAYERKIKSQGQIVVAKAEEIEKAPNIFRRLLGGGDEAEDEIANSTPAPRPVRTTVATAPEQAAPTDPSRILTATLPIPETAPRPVAVASLAPKQEPLPLDNDQVPLKETAFIIPVPAQRPQFALAEAVVEPNAESGTVEQEIQASEPVSEIRVAALSPSEIEDLRREVYSMLTVGTDKADAAQQPLAATGIPDESSTGNGNPDGEPASQDQPIAGTDVLVAALDPIEPGSRYSGEISIPSSRPEREVAPAPVQTAFLEPIEPGTRSTGLTALPQERLRFDTNRLADQTELALLEPLEPGVQALGLTGQPVRRPEESIIVAAVEPLEPGTRTTGLTAVPEANPATGASSESQAVETALLEPIEPDLQRSVENPLPETNPERFALAFGEADIPVPTEKPENEVSVETASVQEESLRQNLAARPISLEKFAMVDLSANLVGKWALAANTSIAGITDIRPPAYGRNAIRERPKLVLSDGFRKNLGLRSPGRFTGSSVEFLDFKRFN